MKNIYIIALMFVCVFTANSQTPQGFDDLIDMKASYLDQEMQNRGYENVKGSKDGNISNTIWRNRSSNNCVKCATANGRVVAISYVSCPNNGYNNNSSSYNNYGNNNSNRYNNYHNHDNGYNSGSYSNYDYGNNNYGVNRNNKGYEYYDDLVYTDANNAYNKLNQRGFYEVKKVQDGGNTYKLFYNNRTQQCIKTTSRDRRITSIHPSSNCNR